MIEHHRMNFQRFLVLTFKVHIWRACRNVLENMKNDIIIDKRACHYFSGAVAISQYQPRLGQCQQGVKKMDSSRRCFWPVGGTYCTLKNSLVMCIGTGTNAISHGKVEQGWVFSRQTLSQRSLNWADTEPKHQFSSKENCAKIAVLSHQGLSPCPTFNLQFPNPLKHPSHIITKSENKIPKFQAEIV